MLKVISMAMAFLVFGCGKGGFEPPPESEQEKKEEPAAKAPPPTPAPAAAPIDAAPPEPTTPEEIELARKTAMLEGRDADVIKYCEMLNIEAGKSDPQALLGCTLAACRSDQGEKAKVWGAALPKPLKKQAADVCLGNKISL